MIQTESEAKGFFVAAILSQASREGVVLSDNERWMLRFSEADPEFVVDLERVHAFEGDTSDRAYEAKVAGLIRRAYEHDRGLNSDATAIYREASDCLSRGDHYLLVMVDEALRDELQRGPTRVLVRSGLFLIVVPAAVLTLVIAVGLAGVVVTGQTGSVREALPFAGGCVLFAGMSWYLIRLVIRRGRA